MANEKSKTLKRAAKSLPLRPLDHAKAKRVKGGIPPGPPIRPFPSETPTSGEEKI